VSSTRSSHWHCPTFGAARRRTKDPCSPKPHDRHGFRAPDIYFLTTLVKITIQRKSVRFPSRLGYPNPECRENRPRGRTENKPEGIAMWEYFLKHEVRGPRAYKQRTGEPTGRRYSNSTAIRPVNRMNVSTSRPTEHAVNRRRKSWQSRWVLSTRNNFLTYHLEIKRGNLIHTYTGRRDPAT
jgi:hypothetical protein